MFKIYPLYGFVCFTLLFSAVLCFNLDARNVKAVSSFHTGDYFGYSLFLKNDGRFEKSPSGEKVAKKVFF